MAERISRVFSGILPEKQNADNLEGSSVIMDKIALALVTVGALNWGCVGIFRFDLVAWLCGGATSMLSRVVYTLVGIAGVWCISLLFRDTEAEREH